MFLLYAQIYLVSSFGKPNLSYHTCRFVVYISTLAKPMGIYLTLLFSFERFMQKVLPHFSIRRQLFQRLFQLFILLGMIAILAIRLYEVLKVLSSNQSTSSGKQNDNSNNSTDFVISDQFCSQSISMDDYARILSFYVIQYWFEYVALVIIFLLLISIIIQQYRLPLSPSRFSINTQFYFSLAICLILSELILFFFHLIIKNEKYQSSDWKIISLKSMLFTFNFRCIVLPLVICWILCDPLKKFFYELIIVRPYLDNIDENDQNNAVEHRSEPFSAPQRTRNRFQQKFRRTPKKNNQDNNNEPTEQVESQDGL